MKKPVFDLGKRVMLFNDTQRGRVGNIEKRYVLIDFDDPSKTSFVYDVKIPIGIVWRVREDHLHEYKGLQVLGG